MKYFTILLFLSFSLTSTYAQTMISGNIISSKNNAPLAGATIRVEGQAVSVSSDAEGQFSLRLQNGVYTLTISMMGFMQQEIQISVPYTDTLTVSLVEDAMQLQEVEVVSTGYYEIPKERATGSFVHVDNELLNRSVSTDIISRLEGITGSLAFDRRRSDGNETPQLRIRGLSTIRSEQSPLIIVDNFPYEGDIYNINPNDVESVTILRDAAAASIWGARAGNGVIVIVTKSGKFGDSLEISANSNFKMAPRPDLYYNPLFLTSPDFITVEQTLFEQGYYTSEENSVIKAPLSPVIELLIQNRDGVIGAAEFEKQMDLYKQYDIREQAEKLLYKSEFHQQHALSFRGGGDRIQFYASGGFDKNTSNLIGNDSKRITLTTNTTLKLNSKLIMQLGVNYNHRDVDNDGIPLSSIRFSSSKSVYPYAQLENKEGVQLPIVHGYRTSYVDEAEQDGLLDWKYRPLQERALNKNHHKNAEFLVNTGLNYKVTSGLSTDFKFQYQRIFSANQRINAPNSYVVRDLVNRYTQEDGQRIFPEGGILNLRNTLLTSYSIRGQVNYAAKFGRKHDISSFAGFETRIANNSGEGFEFYGYDEEILTYQTRLDYMTRYPVKPRGTAQIPSPSTSLTELEDRFVSYFSNLSYTFEDKYIVNASVRWDASNLFGVRTNQKGVPLWSAGAAWLVSEMPFYQIVGLPLLKIRGTYGQNGNINKMVTAYPTSAYSTDPLTGLQQARVIGPGNADLRWERVTTMNLGLDFRANNRRLSGSVEYFIKQSRDLIGDPPVVDPTAGYASGLGTSYLLNYANLTSRGLDMELSSLNFNKGVSWRTDFLMSFVRNKVTRYAGGGENLIGFSSNLGAAPQEGQSLDALYVLPWHGLDPANGDPMVMLDGEISKDYTAYMRSIDSRSKLVYAGVTFPPYFGSVRNTFSWKNFSVSANIVFKFGYTFRRNSIDYNRLFSNWEGHKDFRDRWQKSGDEEHTVIPSMPQLPLVANRDQVYLVSEALIESGDHVRLQDTNISYVINGHSLNLFKEMRMFVYAQPPGWIWKRNNTSLNPDQPESQHRKQLHIAMGINITF